MVIVCHCEAVNDRTVKAAIACGAHDVSSVGDFCRAGTECGGCHTALARLLAESDTSLLASSGAAVA
jgi:bacterioferritin-associated ferredoxin